MTKRRKDYDSLTSTYFVTINQRGLSPPITLTMKKEKRSPHRVAEALLSQHSNVTRIDVEGADNVQRFIPVSDGRVERVSLEPRA